MIYRCEGCGGKFHLGEMDRLTNDVLPDLTTHVEHGLCPVCTLATINAMGQDAALHPIAIVNGRSRDEKA